MMNKSTSQILLFLIFFLSFIGYYIIVLTLINSGFGAQTRLVTIPARVLISVCLILLFCFNFSKAKLHRNTRWFSLFAFCYFIRILADGLSNEVNSQTPINLLFYFASFAVIPFFVISSLPLRDKYIVMIQKAMQLSGLFFAILSIFSYQQFIGNVGRLTSGVSKEEDLISPLILSYCSTMAIGVSVGYLLYNKTSLIERLISFVTVVLSIIPFFLGASRGALLALFLPFALMVIVKNSAVKMLKSILLIVGSLIAIIYLDQVLGSGLLERFTNLSSDIDQSNSSAIRLVMWHNSFEQFQDFPLFGDKLAVNGFNGFYPHNIILEVLQATGIFGFVPFIILLFKAFATAFKIFRYQQAYSWISVVFLQSFFQNMFSGAIYTASWLWLSMALLFSVDWLLHYKTRN